MILWRISRHQDLGGIGGLKAAGRWHYAGHRVVYLAGSPAAALLEVCVHTSANDAPPDYTLLKILGPDGHALAIGEHELPEDWRERLEVTRERGTAWLEAGESVLLQVPSAIVPETANYLFNPAHRDARRFKIVSGVSYPFEPRLKR